MWRDVLPGVLVAVTVWGCGKPPAAVVAPPAEVTVSCPESQEVTDTLEYTGTTEPLMSVDIRARVTGFLDSVQFQPRAKVKEGDVLFVIDQRPFKNALDAAVGFEQSLQAQLVKAQTDLEKMQRLLPEGAASEDELTTALSTRDSLVGQIAQAKAQIETAKLNLGFCTVTAPMSGRVSRNLIDPGNIVAADTTVLTTIVNDDLVYAYFDISEQDALVLRAQARKRLESEGKTIREQPEPADVRRPVFLGLMTEEGFPHEGYIDYFATGVDPGTGTIQVRARFENTDGALLPGLFVRLRIPISEPHTALTVTERALGSEQGQRYLLVVNDRNVVEYRPVKIGTLHGGSRVILAGLAPADRVIVNGIQRVRPGVTVKPVPASMSAEPAAGDGGSPSSAPAAAPTNHSAAQ